MEMSREEHLKCPSAFFFLFSGPPSLSSIVSSQSTRRVHHHGEPHQSSASSGGTFSRPCQLVRGSKLRLPLFFDRHLSLLALLHLPRRGHGSSLQLDSLRALLLLHQDSFEERPNTRERNLQRASVHSCLGGGNPSDIYLWWILWISICRMRRS